MEIKKIENFDYYETNQGLVVILGYFDGWHEGHKGLLKIMKQVSQQFNYQTLVISFDVKPQSVLTNEKNYILMDEETKINFLIQQKIDKYWQLNFNDKIAQTSAEDFINWLLKNNVKGIVASPYIRFGHKGNGNFDLLKKSKLKVFAFNDIYDNLNEKISSSYIKKLLSEGNIEQANSLISTNYYTVKGIVVDGIKEGRKLGFCTANLHLENDYFLPKLGIYFSLTKVKNKLLPSLSIVLLRNGKTLVESYILNFNEDLYGQKIEVSFLKFLRENKQFNSKENLIKQIEDDVKKANFFFKNKTF